MKRLCFLVLFIFTFVLAFSAPIKTALVFKKGDTHSYKIRLISFSEKKISGQKSSQREKADLYMDFAIGDIKENGDADISISVRRVVFDSNAYGMKYSFDSKKDKITQGHAVRIIPLLSGMFFQATLSPSGEISEILGMEKVKEKFNSIMKEGTTKKEREELETKKNQEIEDSILRAADLNNLIDIRLVKFSSEEINVGDNWGHTDEIKGKTPLNLKQKIAFDKLEGGMLYLKSTSTVSSDPEKSTENSGLISISSDLSGTSEGKYELYESNLWLKNGRRSVKTQGIQTLRVSGQKSQSQKIKLNRIVIMNAIEAGGK